MINPKILKLIIFFIVFFYCQKIFAGGLSAWNEVTPYGHEMYHDGTSSGRITLSLDSTSVSFKNFYFYKGYTIAKSDSLFLIINEKTQKVQKFTNEKKWKTQLKQKKLVPFFQRDYDSNYSSAFGSGFIFLILVPYPFFLPIFWLMCLISLCFPTRLFYGFRKHFSWFYPSIIILIMIIESFPQSI
ncbi:hypothetical protein [Chishuiella sp.]|uniref:hypothetical protein n=1 Tax=Chishuiella sp. TaxID=1969467 RepID=UPI0028AD4ADE|nr:hypothetical protein [Chishuiella sp.]